MAVDFLPRPREVRPGRGKAVISGAPLPVSPGSAGAASLLEEKLRIGPESGGGSGISLKIADELDFTSGLREELRAEAYRLLISKRGVEISALGGEGLVRGAATLLQAAGKEGGRITAECMEVKDWPDFRYRCAADLLVNVECDRWALDRGDGREAYLGRVRRKLDFCFEHKINMVWFDGFGWDVNRAPGYAELMRECTGYARRLGIKLLFGGYGGGYGAAYQQEGLFRNSYFGAVHMNRKSYPGGEIYECCGFPRAESPVMYVSRRYGTCLGNGELARLKIEEMKRFVTEINPGFMYVHDLDAANWVTTQKIWKERCAQCRRRWPSDDLADEEGHAGAFASWVVRLRREISALPPRGDYSPADDLVLLFVSPLYTLYYEPGAGEAWERETKYFELLGRLTGRTRGIEFGLREQFFDPAGGRKVENLRRRLDASGGGPGIHIISFGGGDNCKSCDMVNVSGAMAHLFKGAESVCLSNHGMHQEPVQLMNADFLWSGSAGGYREEPAGEEEAQRAFREISAGERRPRAIFSPGGCLDRLCERLWGPDAGLLMSRALRCRSGGEFPVSHAWWSVTGTVKELGNGEASSPAGRADEWSGRLYATQSALEHAREAFEISPDEDIGWLVSCLEVGKGFAEALKLLFEEISGARDGADGILDGVLNDLQERIAGFRLERTDALGGDPGCWKETLDEIKRLSARFRSGRGS